MEHGADRHPSDRPRPGELPSLRRSNRRFPPASRFRASVSLAFRRHPSTRPNFVDSALHVEIALGYGIVLSFENLFETANCLRDRNLFAFASCEHLRDTERLA